MVSFLLKIIVHFILGGGDDLKPCLIAQSLRIIVYGRHNCFGCPHGKSTIKIWQSNPRISVYYIEQLLRVCR